MFRQRAIFADSHTLVDDISTSMLPSSDPREDDEQIVGSPTPIMPDSLLGIIRKNPRIPLFQKPSKWRDIHSKLLGVSFHELPACTTPRPCGLPDSSPTRGHTEPSPTITILSSALTNILSDSSTADSTAVKDMLMTMWPMAFAKWQPLPDLHIRFGDKVYHKVVDVQALWNFPSHPSTLSSQSSVATIPAGAVDPSPSPPIHCTAGLPMMCYIKRRRLELMRKSMLRVLTVPDENRNFPVRRLRKLRGKLLIPEKPDQDPYFVAILLAMAQRHFYPPSARVLTRDSPYQLQKPTSNRPDFYDVSMRILTHDDEKEEFLIYTSCVTAQFLDRFFDPSGAYYDEDGTIAGMKIEFTRVPIWPILGLRERLGRALGEDIVGPIDSNQMETWEGDSSGSGSESESVKVKAGDPKFERKRRLYGSLDEGSDGDQPAIGDKKQRLRKKKTLVEVIV